MAALTAAMFVMVEQPLRRMRAPPWRQSAGFVAVVLACAGATYATFRADGVVARMPQDRLALLRLQSFGLDSCARRTDADCTFGDANAPRSLELIGDSFVQQYVSAFDAPLRARARGGHTSTISGCPVLVGVTSPGPRERQCAEYRDRELARVTQSAADIVVIGQAWNVYLDQARGADGAPLAAAGLAGQVAATVRLLDRPGRRFLVIGAQVRPTACSFDRLRMLPGPLWHQPPRPCEPVPRQQAVAEGEPVDEALSAALAQHAHVTLLRPSEVYCDDGCPVVSDDLWFFQDAGHFTVAGAQRMGVRAAAIFARLLSGE